MRGYKIMVLGACLFVSCGAKHNKIVTIKQQKYIDSVCRLPHLTTTIEAYQTQINKINAESDRSKEMESRERNRTIIRNN